MEKFFSSFRFFDLKFKISPFLGNFEKNLINVYSAAQSMCRPSEGKELTAYTLLRSVLPLPQLVNESALAPARALFALVRLIA